jgi:hypothetical protein
MADTLRDVVTEFCLMGDRVEALEAINALIRAADAAAYARGREDALREAEGVIRALSNSKRGNDYGSIGGAFEEAADEVHDLLAPTREPQP